MARIGFTPNLAVELLGTGLGGCTVQDAFALPVELAPKKGDGVLVTDAWFFAEGGAAGCGSGSLR